jgi:muconolactone delta-isomerase
MQFLTLCRRRTEAFADADFATLIDDEIQRARALYVDGFIRQIWHRGDILGACILVESDSEEHAREVLDTLPLVEAGMLEITIIPLKPYAGFGPRMTVKG